MSERPHVIRAVLGRSLLWALLALGGCAAGYKPPVDLQQSGASQAQHDADLADCRRQASNLSLAVQQTNSIRTFGANPVSNHAATYDDQNPADMALVSQPGGVKKFLDVCMQRKGYQFAD
jgi:hypothetical protein